MITELERLYEHVATLQGQVLTLQNQVNEIDPRTQPQFITKEDCDKIAVVSVRPGEEWYVGDGLVSEYGNPCEIVGFTPTSIRTRCDDGSSGDMPFARYVGYNRATCEFTEGDTLEADDDSGSPRVAPEFGFPKFCKSDKFHVTTVGRGQFTVERWGDGLTFKVPFMMHWLFQRVNL
jgi:hypothetical protein